MSLLSAFSLKSSNPNVRTPWHIMFARLRRNRAALFGFWIIVALVATAALAEVLSPYSPTALHRDQLSQGPSRQFWLGTDYLGRDILSRVIYGSRLSLIVGIFSIIFSMALGIPLGTLSGYYGGKIDNLIMRVMELLLAFPIFLLAVMIMVVLGPSVMNVIVALGIVRIPIFARLVRGSVLSVKEIEYVAAAKALALPDRRILSHHILPNCLGPIIVMATLSIGHSIIIEASLSFLGLGTQPPTPSWGFDLKTALRFIEVDYWPVVVPGLAIMLTVLGFNLFGDGLRDALDPRMKE